MMSATNKARASRIAIVQAPLAQLRSRCDAELATVRQFRIVRTEGNCTVDSEVNHYNLATARRRSHEVAGEADAIAALEELATKMPAKTATTAVATTTATTVTKGNKQ